MALWGKTDDYAGRPKYTYPGKLTFDGSSASVVNVTNNTILSVRHRIQTGDPVIYSTTGTVITATPALVSGTTYYAIRVDQDNIKLATTAANALAGTAIDLTAVGVGTTHQIVNANIFFVDETEAQLKANKDKGINGAGWWKIVSFTDGAGDIRWKTELLIAMDVTAAVAGDAADDAVVPDTESYATITTQPSNASVTAPATATFTVAASLTGAGALTYQWQVSTSATPKWTNVATGTGGTTASYTTAATVTGDSGNRYRCLVSTNATGAAVVTSNVARLAVA